MGTQHVWGVGVSKEVDFEGFFGGVLSAWFGLIP